MVKTRPCKWAAIIVVCILAGGMGVDRGRNVYWTGLLCLFAGWFVKVNQGPCLPIIILLEEWNSRDLEVGSNETKNAKRGYAAPSHTLAFCLLPLWPLHCHVCINIRAFVQQQIVQPLGIFGKKGISPHFSLFVPAQKLYHFLFSAQLIFFH